jgi:ParB family chromosome partitioning protein
MGQDGRLSTGHARSLLGATDVALQRRLARQIIEKDLSVRETERLVRLASGVTASASKTKSRKRGTDDPNVKAAEAKLRRKLGTRVSILGNTAGNGGRIEIEYYSAQDLDRFYDLLMANPASRLEVITAVQKP